MSSAQCECTKINNQILSLLHEIMTQRLATLLLCPLLTHFKGIMSGSFFFPPFIFPAFKYLLVVELLLEGVSTMLTATGDCRAFKVTFGLHMHPQDLQGSSTNCTLLSLRGYIPYSHAFAIVSPSRLWTKQRWNKTSPNNLFPSNRVQNQSNIQQTKYVFPWCCMGESSHWKLLCEAE